MNLQTLFYRIRSLDLQENSVKFFYKASKFEENFVDYR